MGIGTETWSLYERVFYMEKKNKTKQNKKNPKSIHFMRSHFGNVYGMFCKWCLITASSLKHTEWAELVAQSEKRNRKRAQTRYLLVLNNKCRLKWFCFSLVAGHSPGQYGNTQIQIVLRWNHSVASSFVVRTHIGCVNHNCFECSLRARNFMSVHWCCEVYAGLVKHNSK